MLRCSGLRLRICVTIQQHGLITLEHTSRVDPQCFTCYNLGLPAMVDVEKLDPALNLHCVTLGKLFAKIW